MTDQQIEGSGLLGPVSCRAESDRILDQIHLQILYTCTVELGCSRCLGRYRQDQEGRFGVVLQERSAERRDSDGEDDDSADFYFGDDDTEIDIRQAIYDEIVTAQPLMPLCSQECEGVQVTEDDERESAGAEPAAEIDPRWEVLRRLKESGTQ